MGLRKQISIHAYTLTDMEKQLLRNLLDYSEEFEYESFTIEALAKRFNVSKTSVHRFTQKLGYESFLYFKDDFFKKEKPSSIVEEKNNRYVEMLEDTYLLADASINDELLEKMHKAKRIVIS